jgi:hypothetical protein
LYLVTVNLFPLLTILVSTKRWLDWDFDCDIAGREYYTFPRVSGHLAKPPGGLTVVTLRANVGETGPPLVRSPNRAANGLLDSEHSPQ